MNEFTLDEIDFLRWLLEDRLTSIHSGEDVLEVHGVVYLTKYQSDLLLSIKEKLKVLSSY